MVFYDYPLNYYNHKSLEVTGVPSFLDLTLTTHAMTQYRKKNGHLYTCTVTAKE